MRLIVGVELKPVLILMRRRAESARAARRQSSPAVRTALLRAAPIFALCFLARCAVVSIAAADDRGICGSMPPKSDAIPACSRIIAAPRTSTHDRAMAFAFRADATRARGDMAGAIADYGKALTLWPDYRPALIGRGIAYRQMNDFDRAITDFDQAIKLDPQDAKALYERGVAKRRTGDETGGDADIAAAKAINPDLTNQP